MRHRRLGHAEKGREVLDAHVGLGDGEQYPHARAVAEDLEELAEAVELALAGHARGDAGHKIGMNRVLV